MTLFFEGQDTVSKRIEIDTTPFKSQPGKGIGEIMPAEPLKGRKQDVSQCLSRMRQLYALINKCDSNTYREVGVMLGVSAPRARQVIAKEVRILKRIIKTFDDADT